MLQTMAEEAGLAVTRDAAQKHKAFQAECSKNNLSEADFVSGVCQPYRVSLETHLPTFFERLTVQYEGSALILFVTRKRSETRG
jgi:hypothetical protein